MARKRAAAKELLFEIPQMDYRFKVTRKYKLTVKQQEILGCILGDDSKIIIINGPAGTSKTYIAVYAALQQVLSDSVKSILYIRSATESCTRGLGHLPGDVSEKFSPYLEPWIDKLSEFLTKDVIKMLGDDGVINAKPINYLRGADWKDKIVIVDEAQNVTKEELVTVMTRMGEGTKLILCGDSMQSDIKSTGFIEIKRAFDDNESKKMGVYAFEFDENDVVRSKIVKFIIKKLKNLHK